MADLREAYLKVQASSQPGAMARLVAVRWPRVKFALRRLVVRTSVPPLRGLYRLVYQAHIRYAVRILRRLPGLRAIYVKRGCLARDAVYGVTDIDFFVIGDWDGSQQSAAVAAVNRLTRLSPLFDVASVNQTHGRESLQLLCQSDYYFQFKFHQARQQSLLLFGEDVFGTFPPLPTDRLAGGCYMEAKIWWMMFATSALGEGPTAWDPVFRHSICFKAAAETLNLEAALQGQPLRDSRTEVMEAAARASVPAENGTIEKLLASARGRFLRYDGDVSGDTCTLLLDVFERIHSRLAGRVPFDAVEGARLLVDAPDGEVWRSPDAASHAKRLAEFARREWAGYQGASLLPRNAMAGLDDLQLLLRVDPGCLPSLDQIRALLALDGAARVRQRVAVYLLLGHGAVLLNRQSRLEFWHVLLTPAANPEVFELLSRPEFVLDGSPCAGTSAPWTRFARDLFREELALRRSAVANATSQGSMDSLALLRGAWRHLQLEVVNRSADSGLVRIPLTPSAVRRGVASLGLPESPILDALQRAYEDELCGRPSNAAALLPEAMRFFAAFLAHRASGAS